ncbi:MAG: hypothetical protein HPM95_05270 [Alphaproteobacteria bacterium]|nr:hypothetical protein [Alphaproteobacteria bacterium]
MRRSPNWRRRAVRLRGWRAIRAISTRSCREWRIWFYLALDPARQAPVIASFVEPQERWFAFPAFYDEARAALRSMPAR